MEIKELRIGQKFKDDKDKIYTIAELKMIPDKDNNLICGSVITSEGITFPPKKIKPIDGQSTTGNRRSEEELETLKILNNKTAFKLREDQDSFTGTSEQLEFMQNAERAYISGHPIMTDEEWDILKSKYNYKETITSVSPSGRNWIKFESPLPSLNKGGSLEDLSEFLNKFPEDQKFIEELKLDGLTANLRYMRKVIKDDEILLKQQIGESDEDFIKRAEEYKRNKL